MSTDSVKTMHHAMICKGKLGFSRGYCGTGVRHLASLQSFVSGVDATDNCVLL